MTEAGSTLLSKGMGFRLPPVNLVLIAVLIGETPTLWHRVHVIQRGL